MDKYLFMDTSALMHATKELQEFINEGAKLVIVYYNEDYDANETKEVIQDGKPKEYELIIYRVYLFIYVFIFVLALLQIVLLLFIQLETFFFFLTIVYITLRAILIL